MTLTVVANLKTPLVIVAQVLNFAVVESCQPWVELKKGRVFFVTYLGTLSLVAPSRPPDVASGHWITGV